MLRLRSSRYVGYLYQFCSSWEALESIVKEGIKLDKHELDWVQDKRVYSQMEEDRFWNGDIGKKYASFTRNPSAIIQQATRNWRYAAIIDGSKLTSNEITHPMNYNTSPGPKSIGIERSSNGLYSVWDANTGNVIRYVTLSGKEGKALITWAKRMDKENFASVEEQFGPDSYLINLNLGEGSNSNPINTLYSVEEYADELRKSAPKYWNEDDIEEAAEESYQEARKEGKLRLLNLRQLPGVVWKVLQLLMDESEERLYTRNKEDEVVYLGKNAVVGVLIPDIEYFSEIADTFRRLYHIPMYIYRDRYFSPAEESTYQEFKKMLRLNPEIKSLYRFPG